MDKLPTDNLTDQLPDNKVSPHKKRKTASNTSSNSETSQVLGVPSTSWPVSNKLPVVNKKTKSPMTNHNSLKQKYLSNLNNEFQEYEEGDHHIDTGNDKVAHVETAAQIKAEALKSSKQVAKQQSASSIKIVKVASDSGDAKLVSGSTAKSSTSHKTTQRKTKGRVKIKMEFIDNKIRRYTTFSKRKTGIMKKAYELSTLTGTQVMLLVASETGHVYTFATDKLQPMITSEAGKNLIQSCLSYPEDGAANTSNGNSSPTCAGKIEIENYNENDMELYEDFDSNTLDDNESDEDG